MSGRAACDEIIRLIDETLADYDRDSASRPRTPAAAGAAPRGERRAR